MLGRYRKKTPPDTDWPLVKNGIENRKKVVVVVVVVVAQKISLFSLRFDFRAHKTPNKEEEEKELQMFFFFVFFFFVLSLDTPLMLYK